MIFYTLLFALLIFVIVYFRIYLLLVPKKRLIILMYHQIEKETSEDLTVSLGNLEQQFLHLQNNGYSSKFFSEINTSTKKSIILTFDDGYKNNAEFLPGLLEKYNLKATIFVSTKFIQEGYNNNEMMTFEDIRNLDKKYFEVALHSHNHQNFREISANFIENDLKKNMHFLDIENIEYSKVLAYPYGKYPKKNPEKALLFSVLKNLGILFAVRIGNKINYYPTKKPYEMCRLDIKGNDTLVKFKLKLIFGRLKLF